MRGNRAIVTTDTSAVFEAPEHDFPKRIIYIATDPDARVARIDGGADSDEASEWHLTRHWCPGPQGYRRPLFPPSHLSAKSAGGPITEV